MAISVVPPPISIEATRSARPGWTTGSGARSGRAREAKKASVWPPKWEMASLYSHTSWPQLASSHSIWISGTGTTLFSCCLRLAKSSSCGCQPIAFQTMAIASNMRRRKISRSCFGIAEGRVRISVRSWRGEAGKPSRRRVATLLI